jgi:hypothetical protein
MVRDNRINLEKFFFYKNVNNKPQETILDFQRDVSITKIVKCWELTSEAEIRRKIE